MENITNTKDSEMRFDDHIDAMTKTTTLMTKIMTKGKTRKWDMMMMKTEMKQNPMLRMEIRSTIVRIHFSPLLLHQQSMRLIHRITLDEWLHCWEYTNMIMKVFVLAI